MERLIRVISALLLVLVVLAGCADDESERRFANDPVPTEDIAAQPSLPPDSRPPTATAPPVTPIPADRMLSVTGTSRYMYATMGSRVLALPVDGSAPFVVIDAADGWIAALAGAPDGERAGAITVSAEGTARAVMVEASGEVTTTAQLAPLRGAGGGTPESARTPQFSLAWAASGDRVLIGHAAGGLIQVNIDGTTRELLGAESAPSPRAVAWSPSGSAVAYVDAGPTGSATGLYVASTDALPIDPVAVIRPIEGQSRQIAEIAWPEGKAGILYSERSPDDDLSVGGDLFAISPSGGRPQLVGSARTVAQVGAIQRFTVSADGELVAFAVTVAGEQGPEPGGLIVKQISGPTLVTISAGGGQPATRIAAISWTEAGLAWATADASGGSAAGVTIKHALPSGTTAILYQADERATPIASPGAVSQGSPVPLPAGSPWGSPVLEPSAP